ncbi:MAG: hypothetical protein Q9160_008398 [Pyrenula sp. 1 TL-2023]
MSRPLPVPSASTEHLRSNSGQNSPSPSNTSSAYSRQQSVPTPTQPARPSSSLPTQTTPAAPPPPRSVRGPRRVFRDWWLEIICVFVAIAAIAAIFGTLAPHAGQPLPRWPYNLSINALISIYIVVLKAAVLLIITQGFGQLKWIWFRETRPLRDVEIYDDASRGSVRGALALIWRLRGLVVPHSAASVPRTNAYTNQGVMEVKSGTGSATLSTQRSGANGATISPELAAAVNAGIFSRDTTPLRFECQSGNCTVPGTFKTLGYCSQCSDVSNELILNKTKGSMDQIALPSGLIAVPGDATFAMGYGLPGMKEHQFEIIDLWSSIVSQKPECVAKNDNTSWSCRPYSAARCHLYPCVKTYEVTDIVSGDLHEHQLSNDADWPLNGGFGLQTQQFYMSSVDMSCINNQQKQALRDVGYQFPDSAQYIPYNVSYDSVNYPSKPWASTNFDPLLSNTTLQIVPPECIYSASSKAENALFDLYSNLFTGNVTQVPGVAYSQSEAAQQLFLGGNATFDTISDTFHNMSVAMTKVVRMNGVQGRSDPVIGQMHRSETCVDVQWYWVIFPGSLVVLTLIFFIGVLVQTRPQDETSEHNYKSSALALLFHGLEPKTVRRGLGAKGRTSAMAKEAKGIYVKLGQSGTGAERGWRFVEALPGTRQKA